MEGKKTCTRMEKNKSKTRGGQVKFLEEEQKEL